MESKEILNQAYDVIDSYDDIDEALARIAPLIGVDHVVYHSSKLGARPSSDPYIRLTYPAVWIKRYLQRGYVDVDPVLKQGFKRTLPFDWSELRIETPEEMEFFHDALAHGVGPHGLSIPVRSKQGHRGLFSVSSTASQSDWAMTRERRLSTMIEIANRLHRRVVSEIFGEDAPHLTDRELECLQWVALGKDTGDIAQILNISHHTTRDYLKSVRFKLDCVTTAQAVNKAVHLGLMNPAA